MKLISRFRWWRLRKQGHSVRIFDPGNRGARVEIDGRPVERLVAYTVERGLNIGPTVTVSFRTSDAEIIAEYACGHLHALGAGRDERDSPVIEEITLGPGVTFEKGEAPFE